ncbi:MAG: flagellar hook-associated protein FlgK [Verrucomicrobia bacterium]|nr:flagellar hook-associated protein FlgK [Verrucomicrobiota bacterium]
MLGLFSTLDLAARSLQVQQQGVEVAGHNLANVNNPAYARQRLNIVAAPSIGTSIGIQGTGAEAAGIQRLRDLLVDKQVANETSVSGSLNAQQSALQYAESNLGQQIDRHASGAEGAAAAEGVGGENGITQRLSELFNAFQSLSTDPTSLTERQVLLTKAQNLAAQFNETGTRLSNVRTFLNDSLQTDVGNANGLIADIAKLNDQIVMTETGGFGQANDLRDQLQSKLESLAKLVKIDTVANTNGSVNVSIAGAGIVSGSQVVDTLQAFDNGGGQFLVRTATGQATLTLTGGSLEGTITARDGALATLQTSLDTLAGQLISEVNTLHSAGFSLTGSSNANFFNGANAATISVNSALTADPSLIQASAVNGATGDNTVVLQLAQLANKKIAALGNQTFSGSFAGSVAALGQSLASVNSQIVNQGLVEDMLKRQRDSVSGVSLDEEMTNLTKFQQAFQASARLITTVDEMLQEVVALKR